MQALFVGMTSKMPILTYCSFDTGEGLTESKGLGRGIRSTECYSSFDCLFCLCAGWWDEGRSGSVSGRDRLCQRGVVWSGTGWTSREEWRRCGGDQVNRNKSVVTASIIKVNLKPAVSGSAEVSVCATCSPPQILSVPAQVRSVRSGPQGDADRLPVHHTDQGQELPEDFHSEEEPERLLHKLAQLRHFLNQRQTQPSRTGKTDRAASCNASPKPQSESQLRQRVHRLETHR